MTPAEAQAVQNEATRRGDWLIWFVGLQDGRAVATARRADGGKMVGQLVGDTLDELRSMLPAGLTCRDPTAAMSADVVETWD